LVNDSIVNGKAYFKNRFIINRFLSKIEINDIAEQVYFILKVN
jgi:hypothetical protein